MSAGSARRWASRLVWVWCCVGAATLLLTGAALVSGTRPLVVRTGSMAPHVPVGSILLVRSHPAASAVPGEVLAVQHPDGRTVVHRVRTVGPGVAGVRSLVLRGDANPSDDPAVLTSTVDRPWLTLPAVGAIVARTHGPWTQFWLGLALGAGLVALVRAGPPRAPAIT